MSRATSQPDEQTSLLPPPVQSNPQEAGVREDGDVNALEEKPTLSTPKTIGLGLCIATLIFLQSVQ